MGNLRAGQDAFLKDQDRRRRGRKAIAVARPVAKSAQVVGSGTVTARTPEFRLAVSHKRPPLSVGSVPTSNKEALNPDNVPPELATKLNVSPLLPAYVDDGEKEIEFVPPPKTNVAPEPTEKCP